MCGHSGFMEQQMSLMILKWMFPITFWMTLVNIKLSSVTVFGNSQYCTTECLNIINSSKTLNTPFLTWQLHIKSVKIKKKIYADILYIAGSPEIHSKHEAYPAHPKGRALSSDWSVKKFIDNHYQAQK